jgi:hypothetical protein
LAGLKSHLSSEGAREERGLQAAGVCFSMPARACRERKMCARSCSLKAALLRIGGRVKTRTDRGTRSFSEET